LYFMVRGGGGEDSSLTKNIEKKIKKHTAGITHKGPRTRGNNGKNTEPQTCHVHMKIQLNTAKTSPGHSDLPQGRHKKRDQRIAHRNQYPDAANQQPPWSLSNTLSEIKWWKRGENRGGKVLTVSGEGFAGGEKTR